jgi:HK97 family phage portal protein
MTIFGLTITRTKAVSGTLQSVEGRGWWPVVREGFAGAWQRGVATALEANPLTYAPVYACVTLIASDIGKLRVKLVQQDGDGIWFETESAAFSPVLRKPNHYQTRIQFFQNWLTSKLIHGNTYVLKERDQRGVVVGLYILDPTRVKVMVAPDGSVFYGLPVDNLSGLTSEIVAAPASEIIHDVMCPLYHPLCGVSPLTACALAALMALKIQHNSERFFANGSLPGGVLSAPNFIKDETAKRLKEYWDENFSGSNVGKVAVLGDGLKYEAMRENATDAQLIEQLKWTAEDVCTAFHVPPYKIGVGPPPNYNNIEALNQQYYSECLQVLIETIELLLDEGLGMAPEKIEGRRLGTEFDLDDLLRMDTAARVKAAADSITAGAISPDEARQKYFGLGKVTGGNTPYLQQQNYSLAALAERDANAPFAKPEPTPAVVPPPDDEDKHLEAWRRKSAAYGLVA